MIYAFLTALVLAQAEPAKDAESAKEQQKKWNEFYKAEAASYAITLDGDAKKLLKVRPEPVLLWSNPIRVGETNGSVFVWTYAGRAEAVGTVFSYVTREDNTKRAISHSFHSLALVPLVAERNESPAWTIKAKGLDLKPIPGAPEPAKTAALRLGQMRDLARDFSATTVLEDVEQDLRLLPQPLYRNESSLEEVLDGALFTFVTGTDPEMMIVIEARRNGKAYEWQFAAGRFTDLSLKLRYQKALLWEYERGLPVDNTREPYLSRRTEARDKDIK